MLAMEENAIKNPHKVFEVKRVIEEGDIVAVHSHIKQNQDDLGGAVVHIFRFIMILLPCRIMGCRSAHTGKFSE